MIRYYQGPEGSGKTCMMTKDLFLHYLSGGRVMSLPGYELYGNSKKQLLSELIMPEDCLAMLQEDSSVIRKQRIVIAADEVENYFDHHTWWALVNDVIKSIFGQRRKLGVAFFMTGPDFDALPPDIEYRVHEIVHCMDKHTLNRDIPRGLYCSYYKEDKRGMLSRPGWHWSPRRKFYMKPWYNHYDTYSSVSFMNNPRFNKVKVQPREIILDADGNRIEKEYQNGETPFVSTAIMIRQKAAELESKGITELKPDAFAKMLGEMNLHKTPSVKNQLQALGWFYDTLKQAYVRRATQNILA